MTVDDRLMERLRKLATMAERGTPEEAEIAATRLAELMARHQIESIDLSDVAAPVTVEDGRLDADEDAGPSRVENWERMLLSCVAEMSGGRPWLRGRGRYQQMRMYGPPGSTGAARYLYLWLRRQIAEMSREATRARGESNAWRRSYAVGVVAKVYRRMREARRIVMDAASSQALVVVDRQKAAIDARLESARLRPAKDGARKRPDASSWGFHDGDRVDIGGAAGGSIGEGPRKLKP